MVTRLARRLGTACAIGVLAAGVAPAAAQSGGVDGRAGGLFGSGDVGRRIYQKLDFTLSVAEANDSDTPAEFTGVVPTDSYVGGYSTMMLGTAHYEWRGSRVRVAATGSSVFRHYTELHDLQTASQSAGAGLSVRLDDRTTVSANQTVAYAPSYLYGLFPGGAVDKPGDAVPTAPDYVTTDEASYLYGTTVGLTRGLNRRSQLSASGTFQYTDYPHETAQFHDLSSEGLRGDFTTHVSRNTAMRVGYHYRNGAFGVGNLGLPVDTTLSSSEHGVDVGFDYSRPVSASRRLQIAAAVGSAAVDTALRTASSTAQPARVYQMSGDAAVTWPVSTTWSARAAFRRGLDYIAQLGEPVVSTGVTAEAGGVVSTRFDVSASARYASGDSALTRSTLTFDTYSAELRLRFALSRTVAVYGQYFYYFYDFSRESQLPIGFPPSLDRTGVRAGLTLWVPAVRR